MNTVLAASCLLALLAACAAAPARADWHASLRVRRTVAAAPGETGGARERTVQAWFGADRMREETAGESAYILRLDLRRSWAVDHGARVSRELALPPLVDAPTLRGFDADDGAAVRETGETRTIGAWPCRRWLVTRRVMRGNAAPPARVETEIWATEAIPASAFLAERAAFAGASPAGASRRLHDELRKVRGFPVLQIERVTFLGNTEERVVELLAIEEAVPPPGTYEPPPGYGPGKP